jgi:hypothetical protein
MKTICRLFLIAALILGIYAPAAAQVADPPEDDPFADDPFFTRPISEWFSPGDVTERAQRRVRRAITERGIDDGRRDITGFGEYPGLNNLDNMGGMIRFNRVDKMYIGAHFVNYLNWSAGNDLKPYGSIGYSFGREEWLYSVGLERFLGFSKRFKLGASHYKITDTEDAWRTGAIENSLTSFFSGYDFMDYHARRGTRVYGVHRIGEMIETTLMFSDDDYESLNTATRWSVFGKKSVVRNNPTIEDGSFRTLTTAVQFNPRNLALSTNFSISADIMAEFSGTDALSDFSRYQAEIRTITRLDATALLRNRLRAGLIEGDAPDFKHFYLGGIGTMRARPFKAIAGQQMILLNNELHLGKRVGSKSRSGWGDIFQPDEDIRFLFFLDLGWTNTLISDGLINDGFGGFSTSDVLADVGGGVSFGTLRFEFAWPVKELSGTPALWVRFNQTF